MHMQLECHEHSDTLVGAIGTLQTDGILQDVVISAEGRTIKAHRVMMAAAADTFKDLLTLDLDRSPIIHLKDTAFEDVQCLLDFIYHGRTKVPSQRLQSFLSLANSLGVRGFSESCQNGAKVTQTQVDWTPDKKPRTPTKRKLPETGKLAERYSTQNESFKENNSPLKHSNSEPVEVSKTPEAIKMMKKRKRQSSKVSRSLDEVANPKSSTNSPASTSISSSDSTRTPLSPLRLNKENKSVKKKLSDDSVFKKPLTPPPPPSMHGPTVSCPVESSPDADLDDGSSEVQVRRKKRTGAAAAPPIRGQNSYQSFDSSMIDPDALAKKGATLLQHLALWMLEEKRLQQEAPDEEENEEEEDEFDKDDQDEIRRRHVSSHVPRPSNQISPASDLTQASSSVINASNSLPTNWQNQRLNPSMTGGPSRRTTGSECDRPDSGFDSNKDWGDPKTPNPNEVPTVQSASSSPEEPGKSEMVITRQAAFRQPIIRKKRVVGQSSNQVDKTVQ